MLSSLEIICAQGGKKEDCDGMWFSAALEGHGEFGGRSVSAAQGVPGTHVCQK